MTPAAVAALDRVNHSLASRRMNVLQVLQADGTESGAFGLKTGHADRS